MQFIELVRLRKENKLKKSENDSNNSFASIAPMLMLLFILSNVKNVLHLWREEKIVWIYDDTFIARYLVQLVCAAGLEEVTVYMYVRTLKSHDYSQLNKQQKLQAI